MDSLKYFPQDNNVERYEGEAEAFSFFKVQKSELILGVAHEMAKISFFFFLQKPGTLRSS